MFAFIHSFTCHLFWITFFLAQIHLFSYGDDNGNRKKSNVTFFISEGLELSKEMVWNPILVVLEPNRTEASQNGTEWNLTNMLGANRRKTKNTHLHTRTQANRIAMRFFSSLFCIALAVCACYITVVVAAAGSATAPVFFLLLISNNLKEGKFLRLHLHSIWKVYALGNDLCLLCCYDLVVSRTRWQCNRRMMGPCIVHIK